MVDWLVFALAATVCGGLSDTFLKKSYIKLSPLIAVIVGSFAAVVVLLPFSLINKAQFVFFPTILIATIAAFSYVFGYFAINKGKLALIATLKSTFPLFTVFLAILFLRESISLFALFGILLIMVGLVLLAIEHPKQFKNIVLGTWFIWGILAAALTGFGDFLAKVAISQYDPYTYMLSFVFGWIIMTLILLAVKKKNIPTVKFNKELGFIILSNIFQFLGWVFFYLALRTGSASIITPITGASAAIAVFMAFIWLKEKITKYQLLGALITIVGAIIVSAG